MDGWSSVLRPRQHSKIIIKLIGPKSYLIQAYV